MHLLFACAVSQLVQVPLKPNGELLNGNATVATTIPLGPAFDFVEGEVNSNGIVVSSSMNYFRRNLTLEFERRTFSIHAVLVVSSYQVFLLCSYAFPHGIRKIDDFCASSDQRSYARELSPLLL